MCHTVIKNFLASFLSLIGELLTIFKEIINSLKHVIFVDGLLYVMIYWNTIFSYTNQKNVHGNLYFNLDNKSLSRND